ncbi:MAG: hypothetical protein ACTSQJ_00335 [Promethearchaeota archaeon]
MGTSQRKGRKDVLWSIWLNEYEDTACQLLIEELKKDNLLKNGPKGFVSRYQFLQFLIYNAIYKYKDRILPEEDREKEKKKSKNNNRENQIVDSLRQLQEAKKKIVELNTKNRELHDKIDKLQVKNE